MIDSLAAAAHALHAALEQYISVCSTIPACYTHAERLSGARRMLSDRVAEELQSFGFYEGKLKQAKTTLSLGRNCCTAIVPVNALPDEILARIFHTLARSEPCTRGAWWSDHASVMDFLKYPHLLTHVCSRWRRVAVSSRTLWSHIDLAPCHLLGKRLLARAGVLADRAGHTPLYIHMCCLDFVVDFEETKREHEEFLDSVATHIRSLELVVNKPPDPEDSDAEDSDSESSEEEEERRDIEILESCLGSCIPGTLTQLIIKDNARPGSSYLESALAPQASLTSMLINLSRDFLEDIWRPITVLWLDGLYPYWTSKAYHNLVELHLIPQYAPHVPISEAQLVGILKSSPMLRVLRLGLHITDQSPEDVPVSPVYLGELELLSLSSGYFELGSFLRWVIPGSLPLRLSITNLREKYSLSYPGFKRFFECSNIVSLRLAVLSLTFQGVTELLDLLSHLRILALDGCFCWKKPGQPLPPKFRSSEQNALASSARLENLYLFNCRGYLEDLQWVEGCPVQKLTVWSCSFYSRVRGYFGDTEVIRQALSDICPVVEFVDWNGPDPLGWY